MTLPLQPLSFGRVSDIRASYAGARMRPNGQCDVLVVTYRGTYRDGRDGRYDAQVIEAIGQAGVLAFDPEGILLDFTDVEYGNGEELSNILGIGKNGLGIESLPMAWIVGPKCEKGILNRYGPFDLESNSRWIFDESESAWSYLEAEISDFHARYGSIMRPLHPDLIRLREDEQSEGSR